MNVERLFVSSVRRGAGAMAAWSVVEQGISLTPQCSLMDGTNSHRGALILKKPLRLKFVHKE